MAIAVGKAGSYVTARHVTIRSRDVARELSYLVGDSLQNSYLSTLDSK